VPEAAQADLWQSWLPLALPAAGRRFATRDAGVASALADAGAEVVAEGPADASVGDASAAWAVLPLGTDLPQLGPRPLRAAERVARATYVRARVAAARRRLGPGATTFFWEPNLAVSWDRPDRRGRGRFPVRAVVYSGNGETVLARLLGEVGETRPPRELDVRCKGGLTLVFLADAVLRAAIGPARSKLDRQRGALDALRALDPPASVARLVPWRRAGGRSGIADWALEAALRGRTPHEGLSDAAFEGCVDFLVELFRAGGRAPGDPLRQRAAALGAAALGERLDRELAGLPRGFAHADFGLPNLLVEGDRLVGVVDWEAAGDGRLPFLDLLHLEVERRLGPREELGEGFVRHLLPWARGGGDRSTRRYADALGVRLDGDLLVSLAVAWWVDTIGYAVETYDPSTRWRRDWWERNVELPLAELRRSGAVPADGP
jgi:hypothetical protein